MATTSNKTDIFDGIEGLEPVEAAPSAPVTNSSDDIFSGVEGLEEVAPSQNSVKPVIATGPNLTADPSQTDSPHAFIKGFGKGLGNMALDIGELAADAGNAIGATEGAKALKGVIKSIRPSLLSTSDVEALSPRASAAGEAIGYGLGSIVGPGGIVRAAEAGLSRAIPSLGAAIKNSPIVSGLFREGTSAAIGAGAMAPEGEKGTAAAIGFGIGAPLGAAGGLLSKATQGGYKSIEPAIQQVERLGLASNSPEAIAAARNELISGGARKLKQNINDQVTKQVEDTVNTIRPSSTFIPDKSPNQIIVDKAQNTFANVVKAKEEAYAPLTASTVKIDVPEIKVSRANTSQYLPESKLPQQATFSEIQAYRQELDTGISVAKRDVGIEAKKSVKELTQIRNELTTKLQLAAEETGMPGQFLKAENIYKNEYLPFKSLSPKTGKLNTPDEVDAAWKNVNTLLNAKSPDPKKLRNLVSSLGPEGKDIVGWATLQNALTSARSGDDLSLQIFNNAVNKYKTSGLESIFAKPEYKQAVYGINRIVQDGIDTAVTARGINLPVVGQLIDYMLQSKAGINTLIKFGKADRKSRAYKSALQQFVTGGTNYIAQHPYTRDRQQEALNVGPENQE